MWQGCLLLGRAVIRAEKGAGRWSRKVEREGGTGRWSTATTGSLRCPNLPTFRVASWQHVRPSFTFPVIVSFNVRDDGGGGGSANKGGMKRYPTERSRPGPVDSGADPKPFTRLARKLDGGLGRSVESLRCQRAPFGSGFGRVAYLECQLQSPGGESGAFLPVARRTPGRRRTSGNADLWNRV